MLNASNNLGFQGLFQVSELHHGYERVIQVKLGDEDSLLSAMFSGAGITAPGVSQLVGHKIMAGMLQGGSSSG